MKVLSTLLEQERTRNRNEEINDVINKIYNIAESLEVDIAAQERRAVQGDEIESHVRIIMDLIEKRIPEKIQQNWSRGAE